DHLREDRRGARPRPEHLLAVGGGELFYARQQPLFHPRALLAGAAHLCFPLPRLRPRTISASERLFCLRVRYPSVGTPHGVTGWRPAVVEPSPPPCGWSTGFMAVPRVCGRTPMWRLRPALPTFTSWWSA